MTLKRETAWRWICQQQVFDSVLLSKHIDVSRNYASHLVKKWHESGHLKLCGNEGATKHYAVNMQLIDTTPPGWGKEPVSTRKKRKTKRKSGQQKMWNTMKISRSFSKLELVMTTNATPRTVEGYIHQLVKAGYLKVLAAAAPHKGIASKYLLTRDTGRHAPIVRKTGCFDQNQQRFYPFLVKEGADENVA